MRRLLERKTKKLEKENKRLEKLNVSEKEKRLPQNEAEAELLVI